MRTTNTSIQLLAIYLCFAVPSCAQEAHGNGSVSPQRSQPTRDAIALAEADCDCQHDCIKVDCGSDAQHGALAETNCDCQSDCMNKDCGCAGQREGASEVQSIPLGDSQRKGGDDPEVVIVLSSDFECPYCARIVPTLQRVLDTYGEQVALVFKHNPLPFHRNATAAAVAAEAAGRQGKFWEMHDLLLANQRNLSKEMYLNFASQLGLDVERFAGDLEDPEFVEKIESDKKLVRSLGAQGVPTLWINGQKLTGARDFTTIKALVDKHLR